MKTKLVRARAELDNHMINNVNLSLIVMAATFFSGCASTTPATYVVYVPYVADQNLVPPPSQSVTPPAHTSAVPPQSAEDGKATIWRQGYQSVVLEPTTPRGTVRALVSLQPVEYSPLQGIYPAQKSAAYQSYPAGYYPPQQYDEGAYPSSRSPVLAPAVGALIGGLIGNSIGSGDGQVAATAIGATAGALIANNHADPCQPGINAGTVVGSILGGALGHQIGSGSGNTIATAVGSAAGAIAGTRAGAPGNCR